MHGKHNDGFGPTLLHRRRRVRSDPPLLSLYRLHNMRRPTRRLLLPALALSASLAFAAGALAATKTLTEHASGEGVTATVSYEEHSSGAAPYSNLHLTIGRSGKVLHNAAVSSPLCGTSCYPGETNPVRVADVNSNGQPSVLLDLYSGGAHCCYTVQVYSYDAANGKLKELEHDWGDPNYRLRHLDGSSQYEFLSADDRFAYEFAPYAYSGLPIQIWRLRSGQFVDVTRSYPALVTKDAAVWWKAWQQNRSMSLGNGALAAWVADEYVLGNTAKVASTLKAAAAAHELGSEGYGPSGAAFIKSLDSYLKKTGYTK